MRFFFCLYLILFALLPGIFINATAQNYDYSKIDTTIWQTVEKKLDQPGANPSFNFIPGVVENFAGNNSDLWYGYYYKLMINLERKFNLPAAIYVGNELAQTARQSGHLAKEALAYRHLSRYYDALGEYHMATIHIDKALAIYTKLHDKEAVISTFFSKLEESLRYKSAAEILPQMNSLLSEARGKGYEKLANKMHLAMIDPALAAGKYDEAEKHIAAVENIPLSKPLKQADYPLILLSTLGRARIAMAKNDLARSEELYKRALQITRQEPSKWLEIKILLEISELEWKRGNKTSAIFHLNNAQTNAEKLGLIDLLVETNTIKAKFAEEENRYKETLDFLKKKEAYEKQFNARSNGFNLESYYLQAEKNERAKEKKNQDLALKLKESHLNNSIYLLLLLVFLITGLVVGFINQRKRKIEFYKQNKVIQKQAEQLQNLDAAKSRFFANISHEIRTPLTLILGPINMLLKESQLTDRQVKLLTSASQNSKQLRLMINDILDLRKLEMGKMTLNNEPTSVYSFFKNHIDQFKSLGQRSQIQLSTEIAIDKNLVAEIDREKCRQVIYNLLSNAFKFTTSGGLVLVSMHITENMLHLSVSDTGLGIHPDDMPFIFDRFYQTKQKDKPVSGGTGIGLSLCFDYVQLFNGKIYAESELGKRTIFHVEFPINLSENQVAQSAPMETTYRERIPALNQAFNEVSPKTDIVKTAHAAKQGILVVEDNPGLQEYIRMILGADYQVYTASNGEAALQLITDPKSPVQPDLIISDLMMPVMDGHQLLEKLKANAVTRHIPVIMLTARAEISDKLQALRIGVDDYMLKPFDEEELLVRIENLFNNLDIRKQEALSKNGLTDKSSEAISSEEEREWLHNFEHHIKINITDTSLSVSSLSHEFAMSESTLLRQLKRLTGLTPSQYLQEIRLNAARQMLENRTYHSIAIVADKVGYTDARTFSRSFKSRFGKLPTEIM